MQEELRKAIITKYLVIARENIKHGNYVDTDFRHYSELVETLVKTIEKLDKDNPYKEGRIFFTGLCLPLFQWFNFDTEPPTEGNLRNVTRMQCDPIWVNYLKFASSKLKNLNLYRCILCAASDVSINTEYELVPESVLEMQSRCKIIYKKNSPLEPLSNSEINTILQKLQVSYSCYQPVEMAYLIINGNIINIRNFHDKNYEIENLKAFFMRQFHRATFVKKRIFSEEDYKAWIVGRKLPEDLFLVGEGDITDSNFIFGLAADVIEFRKVRLWFISKDMDALEKGVDEKYKTRFTFTDIKDFVNLVINNWEDI